MWNRWSTSFFFVALLLTVAVCAGGGVWVMQSDNSYNLSSELRSQDQLHTSSACSSHHHPHVSCAHYQHSYRLLHKLYLCDSGNKYLQAVKAIAPCVPHSEVSSNSLIESYSVQRTQVILQSSGDLMINLFQGPERLEIFLLSVSKSIFLQF